MQHMKQLDDCAANWRLSMSVQTRRRPRRPVFSFTVKVAFVACASLAASSATAQVNDAGRDIIVTATPLFHLAEDNLTFPAQTASDKQLTASHATDITDYLKRMVGGVYVNDVQNNPLQPDINYRGFTASPLLGTPQGLSVYVDGVRINQPFGDVVSWDLIPKSAIRSITLVPGSNPLFGRNSLGGALSVRTKDGRSDPGTVAEVSYGGYAADKAGRGTPALC